MIKSNDKLIMTSPTGDFAYSTNALNWTEYKPNLSYTGYKYSSIIYNGGKYLLIGPEYMAESNDGINWEETKMTVTGTWFNIAYYDGKYYIMSGRYNQDGVTEIFKLKTSIDKSIWEDIDVSMFEDNYNSDDFLLGGFEKNLKDYLGIYHVQDSVCILVRICLMVHHELLNIHYIKSIHISKIINFMV